MRARPRAPQGVEAAALARRAKARAASRADGPGLLAKHRRRKLARGVDAHEVDVLRPYRLTRDATLVSLFLSMTTGWKSPALIEIRKKHDHVVMLTKKHAGALRSPFRARVHGAQVNCAGTIPRQQVQQPGEAIHRIPDVLHVLEPRLPLTSSESGDRHLARAGSGERAGKAARPVQTEVRVLLLLEPCAPCLSQKVGVPRLQSIYVGQGAGERKVEAVYDPLGKT